MSSLITTICCASRWQRRGASFLMFAVTLVSAGFSTTVSALATPMIYAQHEGDAVYGSARSANLTEGVASSQSTNAVSSGGGAIESAHFTAVASANAVKVRVSPNSGFHVVSVLGDDCSGVLAPTHIGAKSILLAQTGVSLIARVVAISTRSSTVKFHRCSV